MTRCQRQHLGVAAKELPSLVAITRQPGCWDGNFEGKSSSQELQSRDPHLPRDTLPT